MDIAPVVGTAIAAMTNPTGMVLGEAAQLAADLGAEASQSMALVGLPKEDKDEYQNPQPKSGINFVAYNEKFKLVPENTGVLMVEDNIHTIQTLATDRIIIRESGFLEVYAHNEAQTPVYFDNMTVSRRAGAALEVNAYYPYGMLNPGLSSSNGAAPNAYKYNAKELQKELNLNWLDYGARMYDPAVGRFITIDPWAERYYNISPYTYSFNNPIRFIDPDGRGPFDRVRNALAKADNWVNSTFGSITPLGKADTWLLSTQGNSYTISDDFKAIGNGLSTAATAVGDAAVATGKGIAKGFSALDNALGEGHADGALTGGISKQDAKVGMGVLGIMTGVAGIAEAATVVGVVLGSVTTANGVDDALTNSKGESGLQQMTDNSTVKSTIGVGKAAASAITGGYNILNWGATLQSPFAVGSTLLDATSVSTTTVETVKSMSNEDLEKLRQNGK